MKNFLSVLFPRYTKKAFYAKVKCSECGEEVNVRINRTADFQQAYSTSNPKHYYTIKKEIIGSNCFNLMKLTIALTKEIKVLFADTKSCEFITFGRDK